ncbi:MAG: type 1 glutamine amidotransferase domain-containing protein [Hydrogenophilaceae bacterium]|nr:type 1 glutamine amidotransferase domain-containing protein [Hydrogenophilaceae bacterium]
MARILFVLSSASHLNLSDGQQIATGFWAQEFIPPYEAFRQAGHTVAVATPDGRPAVLDALCLAPEFHADDPTRPARLQGALAALPDWRRPLAVTAVTAGDYDALFFPGGHGPVADMADDPAIGRLVGRIHAAGGLIGAICHGPAGLLPARQEGRWLFEGYRMTCFSPEEERLAGLAERLPWLLADRLAALGGQLSFAPPGQAHVVSDRHLFTGQNPASAIGLAQAMLKALSSLGPGL